MSDVMIRAADVRAAGGGCFSAYLAVPPAGGGPGIVIAQEIFGVNPVMRALCDSFARQGYLTVCPDLFWRQQPGIQLTDKSEADWAKASALMQGFDVDTGVQDLFTTLKWLRRRSGCPGRVGVVGYCLGGKLAYLMATRFNANAVVGYYPVGIHEMLGEANHITRPLMLHIAEQDKFVPAAAQAQIKNGLSPNRHVALFSYPGVNHAFARVGGEHYNKESADLANQRTGEFLATYLK